MDNHFWQRCPAKDVTKKETCKTGQFWPVSGKQAAVCAVCGFAPGLPWQIEMARKHSLDWKDEEPTGPPPLVAKAGRTRRVVEAKTEEATPGAAISGEGENGNPNAAVTDAEGDSSNKTE